MNLKTGHACFSTDSPFALHFPPLTEDTKCDVAIIGGGVTGALVAFALAEVGVDAIVVDRRQPAQGSTSVSTGLLQYEIDKPLVDLAKLIGLKNAQHAYRRAMKTLDDFPILTAKLGDDCGFVPRPSLYLATNNSDVDFFDRECEARRAIGIEVDFLDAKNLACDFNFHRPAALLSQRAAEIDPYRLTLNLHRASLSRGLRIFGNTKIDHYDSQPNHVALTTDAGQKITANKIVFATGYETSQFIKRKLFTFKSTFALTTQPLDPFPNWPQRCLIWEHASPYFYARATRDNRAMIGGEDIDDIDPQHRDELMAEKSEKLLAKFNAMFPDAHATLNTTWAGTFAETPDGLPYIGALPEFPNGYFALGYGGNGITFSLIAAEIIRDAFLGKENPDATLFAFERNEMQSPSCREG